MDAQKGRSEQAGKTIHFRQEARLVNQNRDGGAFWNSWTIRFLGHPVWMTIRISFRTGSSADACVKCCYARHWQVRLLYCQLLPAKERNRRSWPQVNRLCSMYQLSKTSLLLDNRHPSCTSEAVAFSVNASGLHESLCGIWILTSCYIPCNTLKRIGNQIWKTFSCRESHTG